MGAVVPMFTAVVSVAMLLRVTVVPLRGARMLLAAMRTTVVVSMAVLLGVMVIPLRRARVVLGVVAVSMVTVAVAMVPIRRPGASMVTMLAVAKLAARARDVVVYVFVVARNRRVVIVLCMVAMVTVRASMMVSGAVMMVVLVVVPILVVVVIAILCVPVRGLLAGIVNLPPGSLLLVAIDVSVLRRLQKLLWDIRGVLQGEFAQLLRGR